MGAEKRERVNLRYWRKPTYQEDAAPFALKLTWTCFGANQVANGFGSKSCLANNQSGTNYFVEFETDWEFKVGWVQPQMTRV